MVTRADPRRGVAFSLQLNLDPVEGENMANQIPWLNSTIGLLAALALLTVCVLVTVLTSAMDVLNDEETLNELSHDS